MRAPRRPSATASTPPPRPPASPSRTRVIGHEDGGVAGAFDAAQEARRAHRRGTARARRPARDRRGRGRGSAGDGRPQPARRRRRPAADDVCAGAVDRGGRAAARAPDARRPGGVDRHHRRRAARSRSASPRRSSMRGSSPAAASPRSSASISPRTRSAACAATSRSPRRRRRWSRSSGAQAALARSFAPRLPAYATSLVNEPMEAGGPARPRRRGVRRRALARATRRTRPSRGWPRPDYANNALQRLYALGLDAFAVARAFVDGVPERLDLQGATGTLTLGEGRVIAREGAFATFRRGQVVPWDGPR